MGKNTNIGWTDNTFNPWRGPNGTRVVNSEQKWNEVPKWNKRAAKTGIREKVFCASLADVFEDWAGPMSDSLGHRLIQIDGKWVEAGKWHNDLNLTMSDVRSRLFSLIDATPHLDWQLLTKRPENILPMWPQRIVEGQSAPFPGAPGPLGQPIRSFLVTKYRPNVWLLTSVENQEQELRIANLLLCHDLSPVLGLSCEPLLGPLRISHWMGEHSDTAPASCDDVPTYPRGLNWVIAGGESGPGARPMQPDWARSLRDQCRAVDVPFFFKQWGEFCPHPHPPERGLNTGAGLFLRPDGVYGDQGDWWDGCAVAMDKVGKKRAGRLLDGRVWNEFPLTSHPAGIESRR